MKPLLISTALAFGIVSSAAYAETAATALDSGMQQVVQQVGQAVLHGRHHERKRLEKIHKPARQELALLRRQLLDIRDELSAPVAEVGQFSIAPFGGPSQKSSASQKKGNLKSAAAAESSKKLAIRQAKREQKIAEISATVKRLRQQPRGDSRHADALQAAAVVVNQKMAGLKHKRRVEQLKVAKELLAATELTAGPQQHIKKRVEPTLSSITRHR